MIIWRLCEDHGNRLEGECISDADYLALYYLEKPLYEPLLESDLKQMVELKDKEYCDKNGLVGLLFWSEMEKDIFVQKYKHDKSD